MRSVFTRAVGNDPLAVDNQQQYRPRESPAKRYIMGGAVDAGGTLRGVLPISGAVEETHKRSLMAGSFRMKLFPSAASRLFKLLSSTSLCQD
jgi:hypothetical protein